MEKGQPIWWGKIKIILQNKFVGLAEGFSRQTTKSRKREVCLRRNNFVGKQNVEEIKRTC
jgi:hypothetical protein